MALFGFGKGKREKGSVESTLAYLEDLQRTRTALTVRDGNKKEVSCLVQGLDEGAETVTLQLQGPLVGAGKGDKVDLLFMAESLRIGAPTRIVEIKGTTFVLELPEDLEVQDRRGAPRARLNPKEGASLTALTNLFEGIGVNGSLENISESGARVRIEKAMDIKGEKKLPLGVGLFPKNQALMLIKLNQVPKCPPVMELSGKVVYMEQGNSGLCMGVKWEKAPPALGHFVSSRAPAIPKTVPAKARRRPQAEEVGSRPAARPAQESPKPTPEPVLPVAAPAEPEPEPGRVPNPVLRLKKRSRAAVVLVPIPLRPLIQDLLQEDGYGRVLVAGTLDEAEASLMLPNPAFLFLDPEESLEETLAFVARMKRDHPDFPPVVLAAEEVSASVVLAARRSGVAQVVVKPYGLDEPLLAMFEGLLEG